MCYRVAVTDAIWKASDGSIVPVDICQVGLRQDLVDSRTGVWLVCSALEPIKTVGAAEDAAESAVYAYKSLNSKNSEDRLRPSNETLEGGIGSSARRVLAWRCGVRWSWRRKRE